MICHPCCVHRKHVLCLPYDNTVRRSVWVTSTIRFGTHYIDPTKTSQQRAILSGNSTYSYHLVTMERSTISNRKIQHKWSFSIATVCQITGVYMYYEHRHTDGQYVWKTPEWQVLWRFAEKHAEEPCLKLKGFLVSLSHSTEPRPFLMKRLHLWVPTGGWPHQSIFAAKRAALDVSPWRYAASCPNAIGVPRSLGRACRACRVPKITISDPKLPKSLDLGVYDTYWLSVIKDKAWMDSLVCWNLDKFGRYRIILLSVSKALVRQPRLFVFMAGIPIIHPYCWFLALHITIWQWCHRKNDIKPELTIVTPCNKTGFLSAYNYTTDCFAPRPQASWSCCRVDVPRPAKYLSAHIPVADGWIDR